MNFQTALFAFTQMMIGDLIHATNAKMRIVLRKIIPLATVRLFKKLYGICGKI